MHYICLIYDSEAAMAKMSEAARMELFAAYGTFGEAAKKAGVLVAGNALQPVATATTVRKRADKVTATDGPFAETKEQLGGYYLLDCKDLDEAIEWASQIPSAELGSIEVRPVMVFE